MKKYILILMTASLAAAIACKPETPIGRKSAGHAEKLLLNGGILTMNPERPKAQALLIKNSKIVFVGDNRGAMRRASKNAKHYDLRGRRILPGLVDSHTHPGLVAVLGTDDPAHQIPKSAKGDHQALMKWLKKYAAAHPFQPFIIAGEWPSQLYGPGGPDKKELDKIVPWRPVLLFDDSGHSAWANSSMLRLLRVNRHTKDPAPGISFFVRDKNGEPTGWIKEFAAVPMLTKFMLPGRDELRKNLLDFLNFLSSTGVTTIFDAGNLLSHDAVYKVISELDKQGLLPLRYHGSYHIIYPGQIKNAAAELERLRREYGGKRLKFNTIKIHMDGVTEIRTAAYLKPYKDDPANRGRTLFSRERLSRFILELNEKKIDLHLHVVGDAATRTALDAVEAARKKIGPPRIRITLTHLEHVPPRDIKRFKQLGVVANFTPHWFGGYFGDSSPILGKERAHANQQARSFFDAGALVTFSSDVTTVGEMHRANPFFGMQLAAGRAEPGSSVPSAAPADQVVSMEQAIRAYTRNGAYQLRLEQETGMLKAGRAADLIVLNKDPLSTKLGEMHSIKPDAVMLDGRIVYGKL